MDMKPLNLDAVLADPDFYSDAIQRVFTKKNLHNKAFTEAHKGVSYYGAFLQHRSLAHTLAKTVSRGDYQCSPVELWMLRLRKKTRAAHLPTYTDQIVGSVVSRVISQNARIMGQPGLYSYLPGVSNYTAMQDFATYVRRHRHQVSDPRQRGLFVLQSDFEKYGDNLPVHQEAYIWQRLRDVIDVGGAISDTSWKLVQTLVRPVVHTNRDSHFSRLFGIPMGVPIVPMVNNLAASPLDELLAKWNDAFYARFNDDFIIAHPDRNIVLEANHQIDGLLEPLGVRRNQTKDILSYFTGSGRHCDEDAEFRPCSRIDFLGLSVSFNGTMASGPKRITRFAREICRRLDRTANALTHMQFDEKTRHLVNVTNRMLTREHPFSAPGLKGILRDTNDRALLKQIDYQIARKLTQVATGLNGTRGFRRLPIRALRQRWGLISLVAERNSPSRSDSDD
ncbi:MAG: reverse transcriptase domain-containing protein [Alphaproteobacteria bacterium]|nr:reverse transcriptase domain-containing protein [Alphaproteobacteria bacterium]